MVNVAKYTSPFDPMGMESPWNSEEVRVIFWGRTKSSETNRTSNMNEMAKL